MSNYRVYQIGTKFWLVDMATMTSFKMETVSKVDIIPLGLNAQNSGTPPPAQPPHPNSPKQKSAPTKQKLVFVREFQNDGFKSKNQNQMTAHSNTHPPPSIRPTLQKTKNGPIKLKIGTKTNFCTEIQIFQYSTLKTKYPTHNNHTRTPSFKF